MIPRLPSAPIHTHRLHIPTSWREIKIRRVKRTMYTIIVNEEALRMWRKRLAGGLWKKWKVRVFQFPSTLPRKIMQCRHGDLLYIIIDFVTLPPGPRRRTTYPRIERGDLHERSRGKGHSDKVGEKLNNKRFLSIGLRGFFPPPQGLFFLFPFLSRF